MGSKNKRKNVALSRRLLLALALVFLTIFLVGVFLFAFTPDSNDSQAAFNSSTGRFEDSIIIPHQVAQYTYVYENASASSEVGVFELELQNTVGSFPNEVLQVVSITDSYPTGPNGNLQSGGQTVNVPVNTASFFSGNKLTVKVAPQNNCLPSPQGGCQNATLSPGTRGKITIQVAYKNNPPAGQNIFEGSGAMTFVSNTDQPSIGWRINTNLQNTNFVLNQSVQPSARLSGSGGTGNPVIGTPYTVVTDGIKGTDGSNLQSPTGKCVTAVGGVNYEAVGINNGKCIINIPINAGSTVSGGQVSIDDGGAPLSQSTSANYSAKDSVSDVSGFTSKISNVLKSSSGSGFVVFFDTTGFVNGDNGVYSRFYFDTESQATTDKNHFGGSPFVIPLSLKPEAATQICVVVAKPDNSIIENSGNCEDLEPKAEVNSEEGKIGIVNDEIEDLNFICDVAILSSLTDCTIVFAADKTLPSEGLGIAIGNVPLGGECTKSSDVVSCTRVPVGDVLGTNLVYAGVGQVEPILTGEFSVVVDADGQNIDEVLNEGENLTEEQIAELNRLADEFDLETTQTTDNSDTGTTDNISTDGDLSRTGGGILITFGAVGFLSVLAIYMTSRKKYILDSREQIVTRKKK